MPENIKGAKGIFSCKQRSAQEFGPAEYCIYLYEVHVKKSVTQDDPTFLIKNVPDFPPRQE